jgi:hypothetical protein
MHGEVEKLLSDRNGDRRARTFACLPIFSSGQMLKWEIGDYYFSSQPPPPKKQLPASTSYFTID